MRLTSCDRRLRAASARAGRIVYVRVKELFGLPVTITIPAQPEFVHILRSVAAGVAARLDYSFDEIDDLRIALDEACAELLRSVPEVEALTVRLIPNEHGLELIARAEGSADGEWPPPRLEGSLAWQVLSALVDGEPAFVREQGKPTVRMSKRIGWSNGDPG
ncbi:MAG TPA: anti-sigma factor [Actinomycetota bacterium]|nr:anti-sigma factor [Actinomycetota bacterium]